LDRRGVDDSGGGGRRGQDQEQAWRKMVTFNDDVSVRPQSIYDSEAGSCPMGGSVSAAAQQSYPIDGRVAAAAQQIYPIDGSLSAAALQICPDIPQQQNRPRLSQSLIDRPPSCPNYLIDRPTNFPKYLGDSRYGKPGGCPQSRSSYSEPGSCFVVAARERRGVVSREGGTEMRRGEGPEGPDMRRGEGPYYYPVYEPIERQRLHSTNTPPVSESKCIVI